MAASPTFQKGAGREPAREETMKTFDLTDEGGEITVNVTTAAGTKMVVLDL